MCSFPRGGTTVLRGDSRKHQWLPLETQAVHHFLLVLLSRQLSHTLPIPPSRPVGKAHLKNSYDKANGVQLQILALQSLWLQLPQISWYLKICDVVKRSFSLINIGQQNLTASWTWKEGLSWIQSLWFYSMIELTNILLIQLFYLQNNDSLPRSWFGDNVAADIR